MKNSITKTLSTLLLLVMVVAQIASALPLSGYQDLQTVDPVEVEDNYLGDHQDPQTVDPVEVEDNYLGDHQDPQTVDPAEVEDNYLGDHQDPQTVDPAEVEDNYLGDHQDLQTVDPVEVEDNYLGDHQDLQTVDPAEVEDNYLGDHQDLQTVDPVEVEDNYLGDHQDLQTVDPADIEVQIPIRLDELWLVDPTLAECIYKDVVDLTFDQSNFSEDVEEEVGDNTEQAEAKEEDKEAAEHSRKKRQASVSGNVNVERTRGGRRLVGSLNLDHTWRNRHTLSGNLGVDYTRFTGFPSQRRNTGGLRYTYTPNKRTSFHIGANRNWGSGGRSNSFGVGFSRSFGR